MERGSKREKGVKVVSSQRFKPSDLDQPFTWSYQWPFLESLLR